jgi:hypothetical protein
MKLQMLTADRCFLLQSCGNPCQNDRNPAKGRIIQRGLNPNRSEKASQIRSIYSRGNSAVKGSGLMRRWLLLSEVLWRRERL